eukprot:3171103-Rhodomonas_salina.1
MFRLRFQGERGGEEEGVLTPRGVTFCVASRLCRFVAAWSELCQSRVLGPVLVPRTIVPPGTRARVHVFVLSEKRCTATQLYKWSYKSRTPLSRAVGTQYPGTASRFTRARHRDIEPNIPKTQQRVPPNFYHFQDSR